MFTKEGLTEQFGYQFSNQATDVMNLASEEAGRFNHSLIATEHLFLGLLRQGIPPSLESIKVNLGKCRGSVESIMERESTPPSNSPDSLNLGSHTKKVLGLSVGEALQLTHRSVLPEHILLGLVREGVGTVAGVLESYGIHYSLMKQQVSKALKRETVTNRTLNTLEDLEKFVKNPNQDLGMIEKLKMTLDGISSLIARTASNEPPIS